MKNKIKKMAIIAIAAVTMGMTANAQEQGDMAVGVNMVGWLTPSYKHVVFGRVPSYTNIGIGAKFSYNATYLLRFAGEFDYFLEKDYNKFWDLSVYSHYLFPVATKAVIYPSVGVGMFSIKYSNPNYVGSTTSDSRVVFSLGGGSDYELSSNLILNGEVRYKIFTNVVKNYFNFAIGLAYKF